MPKFNIFNLNGCEPFSCDGDINFTPWKKCEKNEASSGSTSGSKSDSTNGSKSDSTNGSGSTTVSKETGSDSTGSGSTSRSDANQNPSQNVKNVLILIKE